MGDSTTKRCTKCGEPSPLTDFYPDKRYTDGWYPWCASCRREYRKQHYGTPEKIRAERDRTRDYYRNNKTARERNRAIGRQRDFLKWHYDPEYRKRKNQWKSDQYRTNPDFKRKRNNWAYARRRKLHARGRFTVAEWNTLCAKYDHRCLCCGKKVALTVDHVVPITKGGSNTIDNIQPLCFSCNSRKNAQMIDYRY